MAKKFAGKHVLIIVGALAVVVAVVMNVPRSPRATGPRASAYNALLITLDTTRADRIGCYGYDKTTSPHLDALAADAVRFDFAISTSAVTPMSHASILTGLNPNRHGLRVFYGPAGHVLAQSHPTLATILRSHGWQTGAFISAYPASERFGLHWGFDTFQTEVDDSVMTQDPTKRPPKDGFWLRRRNGSAQRRGDATSDQALKWLKKAQRPFFLWVHYFDPHDPSLVPPRKITDRFDVSPDDPDARELIYDAEIFFMDMQIGRLLEYLKGTGEYDHTLIVVVADHGQGMGDHNWPAHRLLYQEQIWVPLIVRAPQERRGVVVSDVVRSIDIAPTVLEVLGVDPPEPVEGLSLAGLMEGTPQEPRLAYAEAINTLDVHAPKELPAHQKDLLFCLMDRTWKLIYHKNNPENTELYNLKDDPKELNNVAAAFPLQRDRLIEALERSGAMAVQITEPAEPMSAEAMEKLRSLGYVGETETEKRDRSN